MYTSATMHMALSRLIMKQVHVHTYHIVTNRHAVSVIQYKIPPTPFSFFPHNYTVMFSSYFRSCKEWLDFRAVDTAAAPLSPMILRLRL